MTDPRCRVVNVRPKFPNLVLVCKENEPYCMRAVRHISDQIDENTACVGFFILKKDGTCIPGFTSEIGMGDVHFYGAVEVLKNWWTDYWKNKPSISGPAA